MKYKDPTGHHKEHYTKLENAFVSGGANNIQDRLLVEVKRDGTVVPKGEREKGDFDGTLGRQGSTTPRPGAETGEPLASVVVRRNDKLQLMEIMKTTEGEPDSTHPRRIMDVTFTDIDEETYKIKEETKTGLQKVVWTNAQNNAKGNTNKGCDDIDVVNGYSESGNSGATATKKHPQTVKDWKHVGNPNAGKESIKQSSEAMNSGSSDPHTVQKDKDDGGQHYDNQSTTSGQSESSGSGNGETKD